MQKGYLIILFSFVMFVLFLTSCEEQKEHTAPAVFPRDSASVMTSYGVNTLISDSGIIKYRIEIGRSYCHRTMGCQHGEESFPLDF